jgi:tetratricopeptide (TPR) repeat protein
MLDQGSLVPPPLQRRAGAARADEAFLRARVEEARAGGDTSALRESSAKLARWLSSRDRNLDEAVELATTALSLGVDLELRREVSAWLESLGDPGRAAAVLKPIAANAEGESADIAFVLVRAGVLKARAGAGAGAAAAFEAAMSIEEEEPLAAELLGTLWAWDPEAVPPPLGAEAYVEAARRHAAAGHLDGEYEDLWRAWATDPTSANATEAVARALDRRGRSTAADEILRAYANSIAASDPARAAAVHAERRAAALAAGDPARALAAALDAGLDSELTGPDGGQLDVLLLDLGLPDMAAARLEVRAERASGEGERASVAPLDARVDARADAARAWARAWTSDDARLRAVAIERLAPYAPPSVRAAMCAVASDRYLRLGDKAASRRAAEGAVQALPESPRSVAALADAAITERDASAAAALERAITIVGPRLSWCVALAEAREALGETDAAVAWSQRCVSLRPGDTRALEAFLDRLLRAGDPGRLGDALAWLLSQPLPTEAIAAPFGRALRALAHLDVHRAVVVARRGLDVFGPRLPALREAMLESASRASDDAFTAAILERWLACGAEGVDRRRLFEHLVDLHQRLGDDEGELRVAARAIREGIDSPEIEAHLDHLEGSPATPDAQLWRLGARALRVARSNDAEAIGRAYRELGGALWDLADDRVRAIAAWQSAARADRAGGHLALALDLVAFAGAPFAFEYLDRLVESEADDKTAATIATEASRAALSLGEASLAFEFAARGVARCSWYGGALAAAELASHRSDQPGALSALYDLVAVRALGRFGRRAAHYRAARHFEREGAMPLALRHAVQAFHALPSEGSSLHLLARTAERAGDRRAAMRAIEQVADRVDRSEVRAAWLLRAASVAGSDAEGAHSRVDAVLGAVLAFPTLGAIALLREAAVALLALEPDEHEALETRFSRAAAAVFDRLKGPEAARALLSFASIALELFEAPDAAMDSIERAFTRDSDVDEFGLLAVHGAGLARAESAAERVAAMLAVGEAAHANVGAPALRLLAAIAGGIGDDDLRARAAITAALRDPDDDALVLAADEAVRLVPRLAERLGARVPLTRRAQAVLSVARSRMGAGAFSDAAALFERAVAMLDGAQRAEVEGELRAAWDACGRDAEVEKRVSLEAESDVTSPRVRADRWMEVAERREARADYPGAVQAVSEACRLDPGPLERWSALERVADLVESDDVRVRALEEIVRRVGPDGRVAARKRLARAYERRQDTESAEAVWTDVLALDPADEEADHAVEAVIAAHGRYEELSTHLARRVQRLAAEPGRRETLRAVRLRRAAILEQRLGRVDEACEELSRLLEETPDHPGAMRYLADLLERRGELDRSGQLWLRAASLERDPAARNGLELRAARATLTAGHPEGALRLVKGVLGRDPDDGAADRLWVEAARAARDDAELGVALVALGRQNDLDEATRSDHLVEAAMIAARSGDLASALDRAREAADVAPARATPQLLARGMEYRFRGAGTPEEARRTIDDLGRLTEPMAADDLALRSFLLAEALDVAGGAGAGLSELESARTALGEHPLVAVGLAERWAAMGNARAAVKAYQVALSGPLLDLRKPGRVAMEGAQAAIQGQLFDEARLFLDIAEGHPDVAAVARAARWQLDRSDAPAMTRTAPGRDHSVEDLEAAIRKATTPIERARSRLALGRARLDRGDAQAAEPLLWEALADGLVDAGEALASILSTSQDRARDLVRVRRLQVTIEPGDGR